MNYTWESHLQELTCDTVVSANVAVDYFIGSQLEHLEDILNDKYRGITKWKERGVEPVMNNLTQKVIDRSARSYSQEPGRDVFAGESENKDAASYYTDLLNGDGDEYIALLDKYSRLLKVAMLFVQYVPEIEAYSFRILHRGNCDVVYDSKTGEITSLMYTSGACGMNGGRMYHHWTPEEVVDIEADSMTDSHSAFSAMSQPKTGKIVSREPNTYGIVPVAILRDVSKPVAGFWPNAAWEELIRLNEIVNQFATEMRFASKRNAFPSRVTNAKITDGQVEGVDSVTMISTGHLGDQAVFYEHSAPTINLTDFRDAYADLAEEIGDNWGVRMEVGGAATASSGFQLIVMESNSLETRIQRIKPAKAFEEKLFKVIATIDSTIGGPLTTDMHVVTDFAEPRLAADTKTERDADRLDYAAGLITKEDWLRKYNPDISEEELAERIDGDKLPDFTEQTEGN